MTTMAAALYEQSGPARQVREVDRPNPGPGRVRVRLATAGSNPTDVKSRGGSMPTRSISSRSRITTVSAARRGTVGRSDRG